MRLAAGRPFCPRLSEACQLLPLIRGHLVATAPRSLATALDLVPIVEDGLFGYELISDRETHIYPILGCNAHGEPVLRKNSYALGAPDALRLVAVNGRLLSRSGYAARYRIQRRDFPYPSWLAAAESAWAQLLPRFPGPLRETPLLNEVTHRRLDKALGVARSRLVRWDPFIEFFGLPNEVQLGLALSGSRGEHGELIYQQPDTWTLHWSAPPEVVRESWSPLSEGLSAGTDRVDGHFRSPDRRTRGRRATDRGGPPVYWAGKERRQGHERRVLDQRA